MTEKGPEAASEKATASEQTETAPLIREAYFSTFVFFRDLPDAAVSNEALLAAIRAEKVADQVGITRSNEPGLGGWHSQNALHQRPEVSWLTDHIQEFSAEIASSLGYHPGCPLMIDNMWSVINPPGSSNRAHIHPNSLWSGVYYVQVPQNGGRISFVDPRTAQLMQQPLFDPTRARTADTWVDVYYEPIPGRLILFPSWLYHSVEPNLTTQTGDAGERVIISFNLYQSRQNL